MIGRIVRPADFQRVLAAPLRSRSPHFAVHYLADQPGSAWVERQARASCPTAPTETSVAAQLSTDLSTAPALSSGVDGVLAPQHVGNLVDSTAATPAALALEGHWLGLVVPKRHAKRAVTRNLIKRQVRTLMTSQLTTLPPGLWVVRLRAPFERQTFLSPASDALRACAHEELAALIDRAIRSPLPPRPPRPAGAASRPARK